MVNTIRKIKKITHLLSARHYITHVVDSDGVVRGQKGLSIDSEKVENLLLGFELGSEGLGRDPLAIEYILGRMAYDGFALAHIEFRS